MYKIDHILMYIEKLYKKIIRYVQNILANTYKTVIYDDQIIYLKSLLIFETLNLGYLQIPKSGCSSIKSFLIKKGEIDIDLKISRQVALHDDSNFSLTYDSFRNYAYIKSAHIPIFTVVRNPYTRVLSAYLEKIKEAKDPMKDYRGELNFKDGDEPTFLCFLKKVSSKDPMSLDFHFMPQSIIANTSLYPNIHIGYLESLHDMFFKLERYIDDITIKDLKESYKFSEAKSTSLSDQGDIRDAPHSVGASSRERIDEYYGDKEIELVKFIYANDFKFFGYSTLIEHFGKPGKLLIPSEFNSEKIEEFKNMQTFKLKIDMFVKSIFKSKRVKKHKS
jgi:hypothetical protein